jgi:D-aspartate ligase
MASRPGDRPMQPVAVVTGADHPTGLGSGRALFRTGARVIGMTRSTSAPSCHSRVWQPLHQLRPNAGEDWIAALLGVGRGLDAPAFLLPTQDQLVADVSRRRAELNEFFRFNMPTDEIVQTFLDKTRFWDWAQQYDLPLPASRVAHDEAELRAAIRDMPFPVILKPLYRTAAWSRYSPVDKAIRLDSAADMDRIKFDLFAAAPALILSQWIDGPDSAVHYCLAYCERGVMRASYTGRKLLQYPRQTGSTAICVGTNNGEVREIAEETFRQARFEGLGSVEVKYGGDGRPYITEPTVGRPNLQSYSAVAAGCNLHAMALAHALGIELPSPASRRRNCWWVEEGAVLELATSSSDQPVPWRLLGREIVRARRIGGAYWTWWDPGPAAAMMGQKVRRLLSRLLSRRTVS